jgi:hypothetical protein
MTSDAGGASAPAADLHLVESREGWRLIVRDGKRLQSVLAGESRPGQATTFTVQVEPNLLPGDVFDVDVDVVLDRADAGASSTAVPAGGSREPEGELT